MICRNNIRYIKFILIKTMISLLLIDILHNFDKCLPDDLYTLEYYTADIYVTLFLLLNRRHNRNRKEHFL